MPPTVTRKHLPPPLVGKTVCVASSKVLYLCQGARFRVRYEDDRTGEKQQGELTWHGMRVQV